MCQLFPWRAVCRRAAAICVGTPPTCATGLCSTSYTSLQSYAGGENNFPLLKCWWDQRVMIQVQDVTVMIQVQDIDLGVWIFQGLLAKQCIKKSIACRSQNCSWVSSNTLPQKKRITPAWFTHSRTEADAFPHTSDPSKASWQGTLPHTLCPSTCTCYERRINSWWGGMVWLQLLWWPTHKPSHLNSQCLGSSLAHDIASRLLYFTGLLSWW